MLRNPIMLLATLGLSACAATGGSSASYERTGEVPGTAGLEVAAKQCAALEGTKDWQGCVAHYDGLYTKKNGVIKRSYAQSADAPRPSGQVEKCTIKATWDNRTGAWSYTGCEAGK